MAVIELGAVPPGPPVHPDPVRPWSLRRLRLAALALGVALLLTTGGAAPPAPPALTLIGTVPTGPDAQYLLTRDRLYISHIAPDRMAHLLTAYDLRDGRQRWQFRQDEVIISFNLLQHAGGLLLTHTYDRYGGGPRTTALDERTGQMRWSLPSEVTALDDGRTGLAITQIPPPSPAEPSRQDWQIRYRGYAGDGSLTGVRAIDMTTGEVLWYVPRLVHIQPVDAGPGPGAALLAIPERGPIEVWDARTRAVLHRLAPAGAGPTQLSLLQKLLMVHSIGTGGLTVHGMGTLEPLWRRSPSDVERAITDCLSLLCAAGESGIEMLDPATGVKLWSTATKPFLVEQAGHLIRMADGFFPTGTVDPRTGRPLIDLSGWLISNREEMFRSTAAPIVLSRPAARDGLQTWLALLEPGATALRLLDLLPHSAVDCHAGPAGHLICQTAPSQLRIWRYRR